MEKAAFLERLGSGPLILDGATGSNLMAAGMPKGVSTELWVLEHPDVLQTLQRGYLEAGSQVLYAPTFQANCISMPGEDLPAIIRQLVDLSRQVAGNHALVAGDISSTGKMAPMGDLSYEQLVDCYAGQIRALEQAGVDFLAAETLLTVEEGLAILDAASSVSRLPVICTMTIESDGSLLFGGNIFDACADFESMGAAAVGINCSVGPDQLDAVTAELCRRVTVPVAVKPNAGMPEISDTGEAVYSLSPEDFARQMLAIRDAGARLLGGCCGTTPAHLRALCTALHTQ